MESTPPQNATDGADDAFARLIAKASDGDPVACELLFESVQGSLHRRAEQLMRGQPAGHSLQATALVNEVYLKLGANFAWNDRRHLLMTAARAMRQVLVDHARRKSADKRAGIQVDLSLDGLGGEYESRAEDIEALEVALGKLAVQDPLMAKVVDLHFFAGCTMDQVASLVGVSRTTLKRRWKVTRAWLYKETR